MKKVVSITLTVLLIASIACNLCLFVIYKTILNSLTDAKLETDTITVELSEKESEIEKANDTIADLETTITDLQITIDDLQKQVLEAKVFAEEKEKELEANKESASNALLSNTKETPQVKSSTLSNTSNGQTKQPEVSEELNVMINPYTGEVMGPDDHYTASDGAEVWGTNTSTSDW